MAKIKYPEGRSARDHLRDALKRRGRDGIDDIAQGIREHWGYGHLRSYRLALELGQPQVCDRVNTIQGTHVGDPGHFGHQTLSKLERWPTYPRRPTVGQLAALAQVFGTSPRKLIADIDWDKFPPADRVALRALDASALNGTTEAATPAGMMEVARPQASNAPRTPSNWWAMPVTIGSGSNPIEGLVTMTNDESTRYADRAGNVGPAILDQLRANVGELAGRFVNAPRLELFGGVRLLRDRIFGYLDAGQPIKQRRDLYFLAAAACGMLASVSHDLGYPAAAMSQAQVAHVFAAEAGDPALTGWLYERQATISCWDGQPGKAREYARRGAAMHPAGTVGVYLPSTEAQACGELGDAEGVRAAIRRAAEARDLVQPGSLDEFGGIMSCNQAKQHLRAAGAFLGIGDDAATIREADAAVRTYQNGPDAERAYDNMAIARFQAAFAHVRSGNLDAGTELAFDALTIAAEHHDDALIAKSAQRLHRQLCASAIRSAPLAVDARDRIEDFLSVTPARLDLS